MALKQYPYLDLEEKRRYDILQVSDIMSHPPERIGPTIQASQLVRILRASPHNGFPVLDPTTKKLLGLVRRDQVVALLECGVFQESAQWGASDLTIGSPSNSEPFTISTPRPGIAQSPLMHWAYHIKDDRYDYLKNSSAISSSEDDFDDHEWLRNIRDTLRSVPNDFLMEVGNDKLTVPTSGDDTMPSVNHVLSSTGAPRKQLKKVEDKENIHGHARTGSTHSSRSFETPKGYAKIGVNVDGNLIVNWLNPDYHHLFVNVSTVMNRGTFSVPESLPVSKALPS